MGDNKKKKSRDPRTDIPKLDQAFGIMEMLECIPSPLLEAQADTHQNSDKYYPTDGSGSSDSGAPKPWSDVRDAHDVRGVDQQPVDPGFLGFDYGNT